MSYSQDQTKIMASGDGREVSPILKISNYYQ